MQFIKKNNVENENITMRIFGALGMLLIVAGHLDLNAFDAGGLFPYYSFHVYIFLFIAGYFYKVDDEKHIGKYIIRKAKTLLLPYFIWNLFYGIVSTILNALSFSIGGKISLYNLFLAPFRGGHQFMLNFPAWFVPALFVTEVSYIIIRKCLGTCVNWLCILFESKTNDSLNANLETSRPVAVIGAVPTESEKRSMDAAPKDSVIIITEVSMFIICLAVGIMTVYLAIGGHVWGHYKDIGRILIMLYGIGLGRIYKCLIEKHTKDTLFFNIIYFAVILAAQYVIKLCFAGLAFSTVWVTGFANAPFVPFLTVTTGVLFWYRIAYLIDKANDYCIGITQNKERYSKRVIFCKNAIKRCIDGLVRMGRCTFSIMTHHIFVLFLINTICFFIYRNTGAFADFNVEKYMSDANFIFPFLGERLTKWIDLVLCILIPTLLDKISYN